MRLAEFETENRYKQTLFFPKPSFLMNPDGVEIESHHTFELLRLDIIGSFFPTGLIMIDHVDAGRRTFNMGCLKRNKCLAAARSKRRNIEIAFFSVTTLFSLEEEEPAEKIGSIWLAGEPPALL